MSALRLYVDWDGTITERDSLHQVIERFGDLEVFHRMEAELERELTLEEVIATEMRTITAPLREVIDWVVANVRVRPGLDALVAAHDPVVVSAGFHELIDPVLAREGVTATVVANRVTADPSGWRATFRDGVVCDVCGERCKRGDVVPGTPFAYVGDGVSDRCVALAATRVLARDGLARWLDRQGVAYEPFADLDDVIAALG